MTRPAPTWDPAQYARFAGPRLRPAFDLLAQVPAETPARVFDLGCGPGNVTRLLKARWPQAEVIGLDSSPEMLAKARAEGDDIAYAQQDVAGWTAPHPADVIVSNAALHWLDDHARLFPHLMAQLAPSGVLAVQMPGNHARPSHACLFAAAEAGPWAPKLRPLLRPAPVAAPEEYHRLLAPLTAMLEIWETTYLHALTGRDPVVEWVKGSVLKPCLDALEGDERAAFLEAYRARIAAAYPPGEDGITLFPFRRLFIIARGKG
ncbi:MAG: methyltransferase domain-containing protein [Rhodospirillales bacterium]|nr:methyltransferase domain-containing protein [Rhodospirillales bacterium]